MTIYVAIDLADPKYCDGCPLLHEEQCVLSCHFPAPCQAEGGALDWLRPQACIDASAEIDTAVWLVSLRPKPYDNDIEGGQ